MSTGFGSYKRTGRSGGGGGGGGGASTLAAVLLIGNATGASDIEVAAAQAVRGTDNGAGAGGDLALRWGTGSTVDGAIKALTTGNARGENAIDMQSAQALATDVASGDRAVVFGRNNRVGAPDVFVHGTGNIVGTNAGDGDANVPSIVLGDDHNVPFGPYGWLIGGNGHAILGSASFGYGPTMHWGSTHAVVDQAYGQAYSAIFGSSATWTGALGSVINTLWGGNYTHSYAPTNPQYTGGSVVWGNVHQFYDGSSINGSAIFGVGHKMLASSTTESSIVAGQQHEVSDINRAAIFGEKNGDVAGLDTEFSIVAGFQNEVVAADYVAVFGRQHDVTASFTSAVGANTKITNIGAHTFAGPHVAGVALAGRFQSAHISMACQTTAAGLRAFSLADPAVLPANGRFVLRPNQSWAFHTIISARRTGGASGTGAVGDSAEWQFRGLITRDGAGNTVMVGVRYLLPVALTDEAITADLWVDAAGVTAIAPIRTAGAGTANWGVLCDADNTNEALRFQGDGDTTMEIRWEAHTSLAMVGEA